MSIKLLNGWDWHSSAKWSHWGEGLSAGYAPIVTSGGRFGSGALKVSDYRGYNLFHFDEMTNEEIVLGFALKMEGMQEVEQEMFGLFNPYGTQEMAVTSFAHRLRFYRGARSTKVGEATSRFTRGVKWVYLEFHIKIADSPNGFIRAYTDGDLHFSVSSIDTKQSTANKFITALALGDRHGSGSSTHKDMTFDDLYVMDPSDGIDPVALLGDVKVAGILPDADVLKGFSRSAGSDNYAMVDEANPDGDSTYVVSDTPGSKDVYTIPNAGVDMGTVFAVAVNVISRKNGGGYRKLKAIQRVGATEESSGEFGSGAGSGNAYSRRQIVFQDDPNGSQWSVQRFNSKFAVGIEHST